MQALTGWVLATCFLHPVPLRVALTAAHMMGMQLYIREIYIIPVFVLVLTLLVVFGQKLVAVGVSVMTLGKGLLLVSMVLEGRGKSGEVPRPLQSCNGEGE